jgi:hypothetical protein
MEILSTILASFFRDDVMGSAGEVHADKFGGVPNLKPQWWDYTAEDMEQYRREIEESEAISQADYWHYPGDE